MFVDVVIEDPRGSTVRHHFDAELRQWVTRPHPYTSRPWPANYGYIADTWNAVDRDELDVLLLSSRSLETGNRFNARVVGLLRRPDGDDKVIAVDTGDERYSGITSLEQVPHAILAEIESWFRDWGAPGTWDGAAAAESVVRQSRPRPGDL